MKCIICNESCEKSLCDDCSSKKRCKECNKMKTDSNTNFYKYKNGKMYSTCIECFNKKVRCEFCNKELNKSYSRSHIKKQHVQRHMQRHVQYAPPQHLQGYAQGFPQSYARGSAQGHAQDYINIKDSFKCATNDITNPNDDDAEANANDVLQHYSTLLVGPPFCGKTHLLLNKLQLIRLSDSEKQIHIFTRSPEQYKDVGMKLDVWDLVVEEDLGDKSIQDFQNCCVVFDDMLDSNQNLIDPFLIEEDTSCDVHYLSQSYFEVPKRIIRNNSNTIILFQQTL